MVKNSAAAGLDDSGTESLMGLQSSSLWARSLLRAHLGEDPFPSSLEHLLEGLIFLLHQPRHRLPEYPYDMQITKRESIQDRSCGLF